MGKSDLLKDGMKTGLDGLLSSTKKSPQKEKPVPVKKEKEPAVHCNFVIDKSIHTEKHVVERHCERGDEGVSGKAWKVRVFLTFSCFRIFVCPD